MNILESLKRFYASSIGKKLIVAVTGAMLLLFLLGHLSGNLLIFLGPEAINSYGEFLHHFLHGTGVWFARAGLLGAFVLHIVATVHLTQENRAARENRYAHETTVQASKASRTMIVSGVIILVFVIYHLIHYTIAPSPGPGQPGYFDDTGVRRDVYGMVVKGFSNGFIATFYIFAMALLCSHLSHGVASVFQTLGLRTEKTAGAIKLFGYAYALFIFLGNCAIVLAVLTGIVK